MQNSINSFNSLNNKIITDLEKFSKTNSKIKDFFTDNIIIRNIVNIN